MYFFSIFAATLNQSNNHNYNTMKIKQLLVLALLITGSVGAWAQQIQVNEGRSCDSRFNVDNVACNENRDAVLMPYNEGFESGLGQWTLVNCYYLNGFDKTGVDVRARRSGSYGFMFHNTMNPPQYLISPELDGSMGITMSFYYKNSDRTYPETFQVGYSITTDEVSDFIWDNPITISNTTWTKYQHDFPIGTKYVSVKCLSRDQYYLYLDDFSFTACSGCLIPSAPMLSNVTRNSVDLNWYGNSDSYDVKVTQFISADFEDGFGEWTTIDADGDGRNWNWSNNNASFPGYFSNNMVYSQSYDNSWGSSGHSVNPNNYLVSPRMPLGGTITFYAKGGDFYSYAEHFGVAVSTTGNSSGSSFEVKQQWTATNSWTKYTVNLSSYNGQMGYVAIRHYNSSNKFQLEVDDIVITYPNPTIISGITAQNYVLSGLEQGANYSIQVRGVCGQTVTDWSVASTVTIPYGERFFASGNWNDAANWENGTVPAPGSNVIIDADAIIPAGYVADANHVFVLPGASITIKDGGQFLHKNMVEAILEKNVAGFMDDENASGWYTIASPVIGYFSTNNIVVGDYDLYLYNEPTHTWWNAKSPTNAFNTLGNGQGYLYANKEDQVLTFTGNMQATNAVVIKPLNFASSGDFKGYNLVGNPFTCALSSGDVYMGDQVLSSYMVVENGSDFQLCNIANRPIKPGEGFFVQTTAVNKNLVFNNLRSNEAKARETHAFISVEATDGAFVDRAFVQIGNGNTLSKMNLSDDHHKVYVMHEGKDYAAATIAATEGELPINFVAVKNGPHTLSVGAKGLDMAYLHLIDNLTGADIDLLETPSYTFNAKSSDYASRFKLLFSANAPAEVLEEGDEAFAYYDGSEWMVSNMGQATVQVIDMLGRVLVSEPINGNAEITVNVPSGVYVMRLINGNGVKTQKIVVK